MLKIRLGNIVMFKGLTFTVTGISAKHYTLTPVYSDRGTIKVPIDTQFDLLADSPAGWAISVISKET